MQCELNPGPKQHMSHNKPRENWMQSEPAVLVNLGSIMVTVKGVLTLYLAAVLICDTPVLARWSSLHAMIGIDWTQMESRATSGHWLTNRFVPEVLSPLTLS